MSLTNWQPNSLGAVFFCDFQCGYHSCPSHCRCRRRLVYIFQLGDFPEKKVPLQDLLHCASMSTRANIGLE